MPTTLCPQTFEPLAPLIRFTDKAEVLAMANDTEFGFTSCFYTKGLGQAWRGYKRKDLLGEIEKGGLVNGRRTED